jgi:UDP-glucose 4-epimerase
MKILVTGGAGFIGSHIADTLISAGHSVVVLDDLSTGHRENLNPAAKFHQADIRDTRLRELFADEKFEVVVHQAAKANVRESMEQPLLYADVNVLGSLNLLECARLNGVRKFIYASTGGAVYGEPQSLPVTEAHPINALDPYGASKHHVEHYLYLYRANYRLQYTVLRYPNVFGPRQDPFGEAGVIAIFTNRMLRNETVTINGTGEQQRDFVYVGDVARANLLSLDKGDGEIFNIGSGCGTNINKLTDHLRELTHYALEPKHGPAKLGEVYKIYLDASKAKQRLGWEVQTKLGDGLAKTVEYFKLQAAKVK